ncbi:MAG TPA: branched-chain amino acid ABC transporter permease [Candidatus Sulfotelmatobacter sp.]|nr:branched-chain amino acid ABC transporter permease [Candidatus Sulfotelmatobacter sp.]
MRSLTLPAGWMRWGLLVALTCLVVAPLVLPEYAVILLTQSLAYAIAAMSLDVLIGYAGLASLGHAAFFAIGAYATAIGVTQHQASFPAAVILSALAGAAASALAAPLALRAAGIYFLMITLAIAMCVWGLAFRWGSLTGGDNGITGIPRPDLGLGWNLGIAVHFYYLSLGFFLACLGLLYLLVRSPFGKSLIGIRDSESRMRVLGYNVWLHKFLAMVIAGGFAGLAGCLYAYFNSFVSPNDANIGQCMELVLMVSLGGPATLVGASLGAAVIVFLKHMVSVYTKRWLMVLAAVYVASALYAPEGILGLLTKADGRAK